MALITCPECGREVSDRAKACIHCGFPFDELTNSFSVSSESMDTTEGSYKVYLGNPGNNRVHAIRILREEKGLGLAEAKKVVDEAPCIVATGLSRSEAERMATKFSAARIQADVFKDSDDESSSIPAFTVEHKVRCPMCASESITTMQKGYGLFRGFVGSGKPVNVCQNCGYKWEL